MKIHKDRSGKSVEELIPEKAKNIAKSTIEKEEDIENYDKNEYSNKLIEHVTKYVNKGFATPNYKNPEEVEQITKNIMKKVPAEIANIIVEESIDNPDLFFNDMQCDLSYTQPQWNQDKFKIDETEFKWQEPVKEPIPTKIFKQHVGYDEITNQIQQFSKINDNISQTDIIRYCVIKDFKTERKFKAMENTLRACQRKYQNGIDYYNQAVEDATKLQKENNEIRSDLNQQILQNKELQSQIQMITEILMQNTQYRNQLEWYVINTQRLYQQEWMINKWNKEQMTQIWSEQKQDRLTQKFIIRLQRQVIRRKEEELCKQQEDLEEYE